MVNKRSQKKRSRKLRRDKSGRFARRPQTLSETVMPEEYWTPGTEAPREWRGENSEMETHCTARKSVLRRFWEWLW